jgi:hypothetical protein
VDEILFATIVSNPEAMLGLVGVALHPLFWLFSGIAGNHLQTTVPLTGCALAGHL